ncbi:MAG: sulfatase-like hydrolase/transferase [Planctomycetota bacterium]
MNRRLLRLTLSCALLVPLTAAQEKPNIVFVMLDDLGKDWIGACGADEAKTPEIDKLAAGGLRFTNAWSMPQCTPTRVALLTGQYPWRNGWVNHWDVPRWGHGYFDWRKYPSVARTLRSAGYQTAIAGKWQINDFRVEPKALEKHGFEDWCVWTGYETQNRPSSKRYWDPYIHTRDGSRTYEGQFGPDVYCDFLIDFMKEHRDEPMFLYYPMALPHFPLVHTPKAMQAKTKREKHVAMVEYIDHLIGRLVTSIDELGIRKRTILIFSTDNGTTPGLLGTIGGQKLRGGKATKWETGVCEPFFVNAPGMVEAGKTTDCLVDFTDLLPTFAELGGAALPKDHVLDGTSFAPVLLGKAQDGARDWIMALGHGPARLDDQGVVGTVPYTPRVIRGKRYKAWVNASRRITALYDLQQDPFESNNLLGSRTGQPAEPLTDGAEAALTSMRKIVDEMPSEDARPRYTPRGALPWDRKPRGRK